MSDPEYTSHHFTNIVDNKVTLKKFIIIIKYLQTKVLYDIFNISFDIVKNCI